MNKSIEQTFMKLHCQCCGRITPHRDNSTTIQCELCLQSNAVWTPTIDYYTGWELAAFWQSEYRRMQPYGYPIPVKVTCDFSSAPASTIETSVVYIDGHAVPVACNTKLAARF